MSDQPQKTLRVAAVQMECVVGGKTHNLGRATGFIEQAVARGAELVLLPELMPGGYTLTEALWDTAEPFNGPTVTWLQTMAARFRIYLGTTFLEAQGDDFYNTFVLVTPKGEIAGRVRKAPPASIEAYFYRAGNDSHVIETDLGRIGVTICYESLLYRYLHEFHVASVDLILQPTSAATPTPSFPIGRKSVAAFNDMLRHGPLNYAKALGVPIIMANKRGPLVTPLPGGFPAQDTYFPGFSTIVDSDATVLAQLDDQEAVIVETVTLAPDRKVLQAPPRIGGGWAVSVPWYAFIWPISQKMGEKAYKKHRDRVHKARQQAAMES